jgi:predicted small secreted protein
MRRSIGWLALVVAVALPAPALAETLRATSEAETGPGSLGETILEAGPGDTIELGPGEYPLTEGDTLLAQGNTIRGAGEDVTSILPTGGGDAVSSANVVNATILPAEKGGGDGGAIETKTQIFAVLGTLAIFLLILELVRRRRLVERYALLWLAAGLALLVLSIWTDGLDVIADAMGVEEPANAIFILAFGVAFLLLLNFSVATSRLSEETKILAQETARLEQELRAARGEVPSPNGGAGVEAAPEREREHT